MNKVCYCFLHQVRARKEVILSAGAIGSPHLLLLSGIGPRWHLEEKGVRVARDLPVGENLMDHYGTGAMVYTVDQPVSLVETRCSLHRYTIFEKVLNILCRAKTL